MLRLCRPQQAPHGGGGRVHGGAVAVGGYGPASHDDQPGGGEAFVGQPPLHEVERAVQCRTGGLHRVGAGLPGRRRYGLHEHGVRQYRTGVHGRGERREVGVVSVITAATNTVNATVPVGGSALAFGSFVTGAPAASGPSDPSGDVAALQKELEDAKKALAQLASQNTALQEDVARLTKELAAKVTALADLQKWLESLLREPHGCFEQTSTSNYPNVMILDYLKSSGQANPQIEQRAKDLLVRGYGRLSIVLAGFVLAALGMVVFIPAARLGITGVIGAMVLLYTGINLSARRSRRWSPTWCRRATARSPPDR